MSQNEPNRLESVNRGSRLPHRFGDLLHQLLVFTQQGMSRAEFLPRAGTLIMRFSACDYLEVQVRESTRKRRFRCSLRPDGEFHCDYVPPPEPAGSPAGVTAGTGPQGILEEVLNGRLLAAAPFQTRGGSFWTGDAARPVLLRDSSGTTAEHRTVVIGGEFPSLFFIPFLVDENTRGVLELASRKVDHFNKNDVQFYEALAETLGVALAHRRAQWALRERVKELTCLYGVARVSQNPEQPYEEFLPAIAALLPAGWQYPEITCARILLDGRSFPTDPFEETPWRLATDIVVQGAVRGAIEVFYRQEKPELDEGPFLKEERHLLTAVAEMLGMNLAHKIAQWALRERVKELTCLYGVAKAAQNPSRTIDELLRVVVDLLPAGWQYPETAQARITYDEKVFTTEGFTEVPWIQKAEFVVNGVARGTIELAYGAEMPPRDEGPFLKEERSLIEEVARQVGLILERRESEAEKARLQEQLRHADRLATIGQLAAGAAHELNEPLGSMLGFAQLAKNCPGLPVQAEQDIDKIVNAALHAREVIKKLMLFARQMPTRKAPCNVNNLVREGLYFLESRCAREGISLLRQLDEGLPEITADAAQLHQVLVNLVVNAIHAMPRGGTLTIRTGTEGDQITLTVEDTGTGMTDEVRKQIFIPFFTTKGVGQGTGLGLSVVHGIVTAHGGTIRVESQYGKGSRFVVRLPLHDAANHKEKI